MFRRLLLVLIPPFLMIGLSVLVTWGWYQPATFKATISPIYLFPHLHGPTDPTNIPPAIRSTVDQYRGGQRGSLALYVTDHDAHWLGLAHGLRSIGIPFSATTSLDEALTHPFVILYPGSGLTEQLWEDLHPYISNGGTVFLIGRDDDQSGRLLGYEQAHEESATTLKLTEGTFLPAWTRTAGPIPIHLPNPNDGPLPLAFENLLEPPLATYDSGAPAIIQRHLGAGTIYTCGVDLGYLLLRSYNGRYEELSSSYNNQYRPHLDVLLTFLSRLYQAHVPDAVLLSPAPFNRALSVVVTHDIDFTQSVHHAVTYAEYERSIGLQGTYFIQTKYVRDYNDDIFFSDAARPALSRLRELDMEIASHTVAHTYTFKHFELGTGMESYPEYVPFVHAKYEATGGSILGELRVSRFLLETLTQFPVTSFRPGHLSYPFALPQALQATGYRYSSSLPANTVQTHLPFQLTYNREYHAAVPVFEFPVTIEDEEAPPLGQRLPQALALADQVAQYGGLLVLLIHPDITGHKLQFEKDFLKEIRERAWIGSLQQFGDWWLRRDLVTVDVVRDGPRRIVTLQSAERIDGLTLLIPDCWHYQDALVMNGHYVVPSFSGSTQIIFTDPCPSTPSAPT